MAGEQLLMQYSEEQMGLLKTILNNTKKKNKPRTYEILVDGLKAVEKTEDTEEFDSYLNFITDVSKQVEVRFFSSANSPKFDRHILYIHAADIHEEVPKSNELSGLEIQNRITQGIQTEREKWEKEAYQKELLKELKERNELIKENDDYIAELEKTITELRLNKNYFKGVHFGELAGVAVETLIRNNVHLLEKIPATKSLAGLIAQDNEAQKGKSHLSVSSENAEVAFTPSTHEAISEEDQALLQFLKQLQGTFTEEELKSLMDIIQKLGEDTSQLQTIKELLNNS